MMFSQLAVAFMALAGSALAVPTPPGYPTPAAFAAEEKAAFYANRVVPDYVPTFDPKGALYVTYNSATVIAGVTQFSPSQVFFAPKLAFLPSNSSYSFLQKTFILIALDYDAPGVNNHTFAYGLHWIQQNLKANLSGDLASSSPPAAPYLEPAPPANSGAHRYVFLLYEQPVNFVLPANDTKVPATDQARVNFGFPGFVQQTHLGDPVGGDFFRAAYDGIPIPPQGSNP